MKPNWEQLLKKHGYKIRRTVGEGAYSKVKLAYSTTLKQDVAIKCISFEGAPKDFLCKFLPRELRVLPKLRHPHLVPVYDIFQNYNDSDNEKNFVCIVMEYAKHGDLLRYIQKRGALFESEVKPLFWQICQAIYYCHSKHFCHRDLKCENILLGNNNRLLLSDFGFCKQVTFDQQGKVNLSNTFCGSAAYAAPETLQGKPYNPFKHDMWSLGVILYIMATGVMPFDDTNVTEMLKVQMKNQIKYPRMKYPLSNKLKHLITLLLEVDERRRGNIEDVLNHPFFKTRNPTKFEAGQMYYKERRHTHSKPIQPCHSCDEKHTAENQNKPGHSNETSRCESTSTFQNKHVRRPRHVFPLPRDAWALNKCQENCKCQQCSPGRLTRLKSAFQGVFFA